MKHLKLTYRCHEPPMAILGTQCSLQSGNAPPWLHQYLWQRLAQDNCISGPPEKGPFSHLPAFFEGDGEVCCRLERHEKKTGL